MSRQGDEVSYHPRQGDEYTLTGVLDSGEEVQRTRRVYATLRAPLANFTSGEPRKGDRVVLNGNTYWVSNVEKETAAGWRLLELSVTNPL